MKCRILHESRDRLRVHVMKPSMSLEEADILEYYLRSLAFVTDVRVDERTGNASVSYRGNRQEVIRALSVFSFDDPSARDLVPDHTGRALSRTYESRITGMAARRILFRLFLPQPVRHALALVRSLPFLAKGARCLLAGRLEVPVLDAAAIGAALSQGDFQTASSVMFLLRLGEVLEEWTHNKSVDDLARTLSLRVDRVWIRRDGTEVLLPIRDVKEGDLAVVRTGGVIPLDGTVEEGEAMVNQSSMTGEPIPVRKSEGAYVYAGTVLEEGELLVRVVRTQGRGQYDKIVRMIEESEKLKSATETRAFHLADSLVPFSFAGMALVYLATRSVTRAVSVLMVDFSCALKLSMPVAVLSAIREASSYDITVKGGKFMEAAAEADTIVFDKTGTLTRARPSVAGIIPFGGSDPEEDLRLAACLEEHYPHSIANAVVDEAVRRGLDHEEVHTRVQYVVAHGISSTIHGKKVIIGSHHFVFEDEGIRVPEGEEEKFAGIPREYSPLYLAIAGQLTAVILIEDPIREEAPAVIDDLHALGVKRIVMMTGDNRRTAAAVAARLHLDDYRAEVLPADKADYIRSEHEAGRRVIMIGDGVNDTPALSEADVGVAVSDGAAIAREVSDITIASDSLAQVLVLRRLSAALMARIRFNYRTIVSFNLGLILLGAAGVLTPAASALLHNTSTILIGLGSMTDLLDN